MKNEKLDIKKNKLENMSYEEKIKELDKIYSDMTELLILDNSFVNYQVLEILKQVYKEAKLDNVGEEYLKKYTLLINDVQENYELDSSEVVDSPFIDDNYDWDINSLSTIDSSLRNEKFENVINEIVGTEDLNKNKLIVELVNAIKTFPFDMETTIAELMKLDNNDVATIDPLTQGKNYNTFSLVCNRLNIKLEENSDEIGGLGYHYKFKKVLINDVIDELVDNIERLPKGTEISLSNVMGDKVKNYSIIELFGINEKVISACKEKGITLNFDKYKDSDVGLPFNIPFIKE